MITARPMKNVATTKKYYTEHLARSEYYSEANRVDVRWFGNGCHRLGLEPGTDVSQEAFERLCDNLHPVTGSKLTARQRTGDRRVCFDFVVSAPKSVSLMTFLAGDSRLIGLHEAAARVAMTRLESQAGTRVRKGRQDGERRTGEVVAATVTHGTSRALDPQLHTHFVVFNATWDSVENRWKALQTTEMFEQIGLFTEIYRSELAAGLRQYPDVTVAPRMAISPMTPVSSNRPASSTTATSGPAGSPTDPGFRTPGGSGLLAIWWAASVMP